MTSWGNNKPNGFHYLFLVLAHQEAANNMEHHGGRSCVLLGGALEAPINLQPKWMRQMWGGRGRNGQKRAGFVLASRQAVMAFSRNTGGICTERRFLLLRWAVAPSFSKELFPGVVFVMPQAQFTVKGTALGALGVGFYLCHWRDLA